MAISDSLWLLLLSMLPISEIRGAMIYWSANKDTLNVIWCYALSVFGNFLVVPFILLLFRPVVKRLKKTKLFRRPANWLETRAKKKAEGLMRASAIGIFFFVAIPLPTTGAWTGSMIAALLDMRFKYALPAIFAGIMVSGIIMILVLTGILNLGALGNLITG